MEATLKVLNKMEEAGVIQSYAIGGAVGAAFYVEPSLTYDLNVFTLIESSAVIDLSPLYEWLREGGHLPKGAGVMIEGWEVQVDCLPISLELYLGYEDCRLNP